ncbi:hypothetical protein [Dactylosporangium cerinum]
MLDMLPPEHPDHYRVRVLDLAAGQVNALNLPGENAGVKVLVPEGAEEEMRGEGRQAVFDPKRERLFTLYSHQPDHLHVRDLLHPETGARDGKPEVHPFVHTLNVADAWAVCVDLPSSFGTGAVEGLTIAQHNDEVWVADAGKGVLAVINADALAVIHEQAFQPVTGRPGWRCRGRRHTSRPADRSRCSTSVPRPSGRRGPCPATRGAWRCRGRRCTWGSPTAYTGWIRRPGRRPRPFRCPASPPWRASSGENGAENVGGSR